MGVRGFRAERDFHESSGDYFVVLQGSTDALREILDPLIYPGSKNPRFLPTPAENEWTIMSGTEGKRFSFASAARPASPRECFESISLLAFSLARGIIAREPVGA